MKLILVNQGRGRCHSLVLGGWARVLISVCALGLPCGLAALVYLHYFSNEAGYLSAEATSAWAEALAAQEQQVQQARLEAATQINALGVRVAELQARLMRLDALGQRLTATSKMDTGEFDFSALPPVGGSSTFPHCPPWVALNLKSRAKPMRHQISPMCLIN